MSKFEELAKEKFGDLDLYEKPRCLEVAREFWNAAIQACADECRGAGGGHIGDMPEVFDELKA